MSEDDGDGSKQVSFFEDTSNPADIANLPDFFWENTGVTTADEPIEKKCCHKTETKELHA